MVRYFLHIKYIVLVLLMCCNTNISAQQYDYIQYTTKDGLPTNYVYGVIEDDEGTIWAYTEGGLSKFDGYTFQNYTSKDGLPGNDIVNAMNVGGKIWLNIYNNKPAYFYKDSIYTIEEHDSKSCKRMWELDGEISYICGRIFFIHPTDLSLKSIYSRVLDKGLIEQTDIFELDTVELLGEMPPRTFHVVEGDSVRYYNSKTSYVSLNLNDGYVLYVAKSGKVYWKKGDESKVFLSDIDFGLNVIFCQIETQKYIIYDYQNIKMFLLDIKKESVRELDVEKEGLKKDVHLLFTKTDSTYFIISENGFLEYNFDGTLIDRFQCNLSEKYFVHRFYKDAKGNIWIGTREGGLFMLPARKRQTQTVRLPDEKDKVFEQIVRTSEGRLLAMTDNSGIYQIDSTQLRSILPPNPKSRFRSALATPHGTAISSAKKGYWLEETGQELSIIPFKDKFNYVLDSTYSDISFKHDDEFSLLGIKNNISMTYNSKKNSMLSCYASITEHRFTGTEQLEVYYRQFVSIISIYYHPDQDKIYVGYSGGIFLFENYQLVPFITGETAVKNVTTFYGKDNHLWIGTESYGLHHFDLNTQQLTPIIDDIHIRRIRPDTDSTLLVASNDGVFVIPQEIEANFTPKNYTINDGLLTNEIYDIYADSAGYMYVASSEGLNLIDRNTTHHFSSKTKDIHVTKFMVNDETIPHIPTVKSLRHTADNIEIKYYLRSYASNGAVRYFTKLSPSESEWKATNEQSVSYLSLAPGHYTFHLKAVDIYGNEVEHPPIKFRIKAAIWQTYWFWVLIGLLIIAAIVQYFLRRERQNRQQLEKEKEMNRRMAELELSALRAQMNPHFIFNALGSIQYYIQLNDVKTADDYLTGFARLMRRYLESSKEKMITLSDEIELLELYTGIEKLRFEDLFSVEIQTEEELQTDQHYLPSMLIQPYVENAVNHGLSERRDGKGKLVICFYEAGESLCCEISDNGIGRKNAEKNKRSFHKSRGMSIIADRIYTLERSEIAKVDIQIDDYHPGKTDFPGTKVIINIKHLK